jgi:hypothetical protein
VKVISAMARLLVVLAFANILLSLLFYALSGDIAQQAFPLIRGLKMLPPFADLRWLTSLSECGVDLQALAEHRLWGCDPYGRGGGLGYPPMSVQFARFLAVKGQHTGLLGLSMGLALVTILMGLIYRLIQTPAFRDLVGALLLLSFPLQLAVERGNIDVVLFVVLATLAAALASMRSWALPVSIVLSWLLVAVKAYPIVGLVGWVGLGVINRSRLDAARLSILLGAALGLATMVPWLLHAGQDAAQPGVGMISHGLMIQMQLPYLPGLAWAIPWRYHQLHAFVSIVSHFWGIGVFLVGLATGLRSGLNRFFLYRLDAFEGPYGKAFVTTFVPLSTCVWLGCYLLTSSFDYRLIYALPACIVLIPFLAKTGLRDFGIIASRLLLAGLVVSLLNPLFVYSSLDPLMVYGAFKPNAQVDAFALWSSNISDFIVLPLIAGLFAAMMLRPRRVGPCEQLEPVLKF